MIHVNKLIEDLFTLLNIQGIQIRIQIIIIIIMRLPFF